MELLNFCFVWFTQATHDLTQALNEALAAMEVYPHISLSSSQKRFLVALLNFL